MVPRGDPGGDAAFLAGAVHVTAVRQLWCARGTPHSRHNDAIAEKPAVASQTLESRPLAMRSI